MADIYIFRSPYSGVQVVWDYSTDHDTANEQEKNSVPPNKVHAFTNSQRPTKSYYLRCLKIPKTFEKVDKKFCEETASLARMQKGPLIGFEAQKIPKKVVCYSEEMLNIKAKRARRRMIKQLEAQKKKMQKLSEYEFP